VCTQYGPAELVQIQDVETPVPGPGQLLIEVQATTVNRTDAATRAGYPFFARAMTGLRRPNATILGCEYAGVVTEVGHGAAGFSVGDRVFGYHEGPFGAHAEYLAVDADGPVAPIPDAISFAQASPGTEGSHYAWAFLRKARIAAGQDVLVNGATGAIGSAAVQLLGSLDVTVTAVCRGEHADLVRGLGAARIIDYTAVDFTADSQRFDAVFDAAGKSTFGDCRRLLKPSGTYISSDLGPRGQNLGLALVSPWKGSQKVRFPLPRIDQAMVRRFAAMMAAGTFRPLIDRTYPLGDIVTAYRYVETGQKVGSVVITIGPHPDA
jgi:NADPH:quinone reductase-like Zn-dependent oxidoreductase